jgi:dihydroorotate dehydrogenase (NAD+) catalytic subunit
VNVAGDVGAFPATRVGGVALVNPVMNAAGTAGYGDELASYLDMSSLGAFVVKSLAPYEWPGNPAPRIHPTPAGMINAVGLQGPGVAAWITDSLPRLERAGATIIVSIWGRRVGEFVDAARMLAAVTGRIAAVEVNLSCPNLDHAREMFAHDPALAAEVVAAVRREVAIPVWAKLSPNTDRLVAVARGVLDAGADALVLVNTLLGLVVDTDTGRAALGNGGGGVSGRAIHPVALRCVYDVRAALPDAAIVGVGGVACGRDALAMMMAGADAVQVGTANFADPRAVARVRDELVAEGRRRGVTSWTQIVSAAHRGGVWRER